MNGEIIHSPDGQFGFRIFDGQDCVQVIGYQDEAAARQMMVEQLTLRMLMEEDMCRA
ncbi:hypothetical protein KSF73_10705 [Burkholderiaceae bacterium DAT-1]|nr:hypothetical protein [Burkholderiaceae bacterium DAT-1]